MIRKTGIVPFILSPLLGIISLPLLLIVTSLNEFARLIVKWILNVKYDGLIELAEGSDAMYSYKKIDSTRMEIICLVSPEGSYNPEYLAKFYQENIQRFKGGRHYEKFEKIMVTCCGYSCWKKHKHFNVKDHIRVLDENKTYSIQDLKECVNEFGNDLGDDKPQWELIIMPKYDDETDERKSVLFFRLLHAYSDAVGLKMLFKEHITPSMEYVIDPLTFKILWWKKLIMYVSCLIYGSYYIATTNLERFYMKHWILRDNLKEPRRKYYTWARSIRVTNGMIRKIREQDGKASVTNVIATAIALAIKKILPKERVVDELRISELVANLPYPDSRPQNRIAFFTFPVSTKDEEPFEKLRKVQQESLKSILGPDILMNYYIIEFGFRLPTFAHPLLLNGCMSSMILSNMPYSKTMVTLPAGVPLVNSAGFTPHVTDLGLTISITRYGDELKFYSAADSAWLSEGEFTRLIDQIPREIVQMAVKAGYVEPPIPPTFNLK